MESERATRDSAGLAVESLSPAIGEARANVGQDAFGAVANGTSDALEGFEPRTPCPADPLVELDAREPFAPAVEDPDEGVLEQVGTIEPLVLALQLGEPERVEQRQVPEALQELPTSPLELLALLFGGRSTDLVATNLVDGILREALHMKSVEDDLRLRRRFGDRLDVRRGHVDGDGFQLGSSLGAQLGEERLERVGVLALPGPHDAASRMVHDHGDILVMAAVRQLIDADHREPVEQVVVAMTSDYPLDDRSDGAPRDAHHRAHRGLVAALGEVPDLVLERPREPRTRLRPWQLLDLDAALRALDAPRVVPKMKLQPGDVEVPPTAIGVAIVARALPAALGATRTTPRRCDVDDQSGSIEAYIDDASVFQPQQDTE